jgi:hypothetical protein
VVGQQQVFAGKEINNQEDEIDNEENGDHLTDVLDEVV